MAAFAYANAMRLQSIIGKHSFDHRERDVRATDLAREVEERIRRGTGGHQGLAVDEHVTRLRDQLLPLVERAHRTARENIEAIRRTRQVPAMRVERAEAVNIRLVAPRPGKTDGTRTSRNASTTRSLRIGARAPMRSTVPRRDHRRSLTHKSRLCGSVFGISAP